MPTDQASAQVEAFAYGSGVSASPWDGEVMPELVWWLTGGALLLAWTGVALLLTSA